MLIWIGDVRHESEELMALFKADVSALTMAIKKLDVKRELKLKALRIVWLMA
jgi:hypothetical protein